MNSSYRATPRHPPRISQLEDIGWHPIPAPCDRGGTGRLFFSFLPEVLDRELVSRRDHVQLRRFHDLHLQLNGVTILAGRL
jgi:hypothetical protein